MSDSTVTLVTLGEPTCTVLMELKVELARGQLCPHPDG